MSDTQPSLASGVAGVYPGGTKWAVRYEAYGSKFDPEIIEWRNESEARRFHETNLVNGIKSELLAARIHWSVQPYNGHLPA